MINNEYYVGISGHGPVKFGTELIGGTSVVKWFDATSVYPTDAPSKSSILLGDYIFFTSPIGGLYRVNADWSTGVTTLVNSGICESLTTDGTYIYSNQYTPSASRNKLHKYSVTNGPTSFTLTEEAGWPIDVAPSGARVRAITYYNPGKIYAANFNGTTAYEIDIDAKTSTQIISDLPSSSSYQVARYGNQIFIVGTDDNLRIYDFDGTAWVNNGNTYNMGIGDLYGVGVIGNGSVATNFWASGGYKLNFWNTNNPVSISLTGNVDLADFGGDITDVPVTVELNATPYNLNLASDGKFTILDVAPDTYDVRIKASHWLAKTTSGVEVAGNTDIGTITLINGDINGDNGIDESDLAIMSNDWYLATPDASNANSDLNGDGGVDESDLAIMSASWYLGGD